MIDLGTESYYTLLGVSPTATAAEIRQARDVLVHGLRERQVREPLRRDELEERQKAVNAAGDELVRPVKREQYDRDNAHLRFFTVRRAAAPLFTEPADRVEVLSQAIADHLRRRGAPLRPVSDVDRVDFTADLTPNALLDGLTGGRS